MAQTILERMTPMMFAESVYNLQGKPFRFGVGRNYLKPIYNADSPKTLLMTGRQVEKSTTVSVKIANNVLLRPFSSSLYVAPLGEQVKTFSRSRLDKLFRYSQDDIVRKQFKRNDLVDQVFNKEFTNGAEIFLRNCYEEGDNIRGLSTDEIDIDEIQDVNFDAIPVILETQTRSENPRLMMTGTPKTFANTIQQQWDVSSKADWVIRCPACRREQTMGIDSVTPDGYICLNHKCRKPISDLTRAMGRWQHRYPDRELKGYRITQMMVPDMPAYKVYDKIQTYPDLRVYNEVLGRSYENANKPFSASLLTELTDHSEPMLPNSRNTKFANSPTFLGIDWGEGEKNGEAGTGYTVMTVCGFTPEGKFHTLFCKRFERGEELNPDYQIKMVHQLIQAFGVITVVADYGGGYKENIRLKDQLIRVPYFQCHYVGQLKKEFDYDPNEFKFIIQRNKWLTYYVEYAQRGKISFFGHNDDGVLQMIYDNFQAVHAEYRKASNGLPERLHYDHNSSEPDDAFQSHFYAWFAMMMETGGQIPTYRTMNAGNYFASAHPSM